MTTRPVTQVADVEVKRAFTNPGPDMFVAEGSIRRIVPAEIRRANDIIEMRAGDSKTTLEIRIIKKSDL